MKLADGSKVFSGVDSFFQINDKMWNSGVMEMEKLKVENLKAEPKSPQLARLVPGKAVSAVFIDNKTNDAYTVEVRLELRDEKNRTDETMWTQLLDTWNAELHTQRGERVDGMVLDSGWDNTNGLWSVHKGFANGLAELSKKAVGAWASPFWCFFADAVGRPDAEFGRTGTAGDARDKWMTYRDSIVHETFVEGAPLCPPNVTGAVTLKNSYADQRALPNLMDQPVDVDAEIDITLQPLEVLVLEGTNAMGK